MPEETLPNLGLKTGWNAGESGYETGMDANLFKLDAIVQLSVKSATTATPPAGADNGDRYLVPSPANAEWVGKDNQIAIKDPGGWIYFLASHGWAAFVDDTETRVRYNSLTSVWVPEDGSVADGVVIEFGSDADITLSAKQYPACMIVVTDTISRLTTTRDLIVPDMEWADWVIDNRTLHPVRLRRTSDGAGHTVAPGTRGMATIMAGVMA